MCCLISKTENQSKKSGISKTDRKPIGEEYETQ